jgi:trans-2,3-dihydro-3-hydroxyanthranilate isomerase
LGVLPATGQVIFEEGVGPIPVTLGESQITMQQPKPTFGHIDTDYAAFAAMLSVQESDLDSRYPIQAVSCGVPFTFIPVKSLEAMQRLKLRLDLWERLLKDRPAHKLFMFSMETEQPTSTVHSRMFAPGLGIAEDPATGGASGPLGAYLVEYGLVKANPAQIISEQGFEMGRPSLIHIGIEQSEGQFTKVTVGGEAVLVGEGAFYA